MIRYRLIYGVILIAMIVWFIFDNTAISFAMLLAWSTFPSFLYLWMRMEIGRLQIEIGIAGEMCVTCPINIRIAVTGKNNAAIGRICGNVSFYHAVTGETDEKECCLLSGGNLFVEDFEYESATCGVVYVKAEKLKAFDCFGLTHIRMKDSASGIFLVRPEEVDVGVSNIPKWNGDEFTGVRKYREGDMMSSIHWKLSGKWDELYVREYAEEEPDVRDTQVNKKCQTCTFYDLCYNK
ncbi:MAG: DUF58 domain-containing protein [Hespellia sp.]|nr:DUF58 domain-containing protein [Hespellia sp.]